PAGEAEAAQLGAFLQSEGIAHLYASPLDRTHRTAVLAAEVADVPLSVVEEIAEWRRGESESEVLERMLPFVETVLAKCVTAPQAIITHGGPIRLLLQHMGLDQAEVDFYRRQFDRDNPLPPAGVWRITRGSNGDLAKPELGFPPQGFTTYSPPIVYV